jgi:hypothetical protein
MDWKKKNHEIAVKAAEGLTATFHQNERSQGKSGGWRHKTYQVRIIFVDSEWTHMAYVGENESIERIVPTERIELQ